MEELTKLMVGKQEYFETLEIFYAVISIAAFTLHNTTIISNGYCFSKLVSFDQLWLHRHWEDASILLYVVLIS